MKDECCRIVFSHASCVAPWMTIFHPWTTAVVIYNIVMILVSCAVLYYIHDSCMVLDLVDSSEPYLHSRL